MTSFDELVQQMHEAIGHLYDPAYEPPALLGEVVLGASRPQSAALQAAIVRAISALKPADDTPATARAWRIYHVLHDRYARKLTQEETAERLGITTRHLRREQHEAITALAHHLWNAHQHSASGAAEPSAPVAASSSDWRDQVRREVEALQRSSPGQAANVAELLSGVVGLVRDMALRHGVNVRTQGVADQALAAAPPSALRQVLLAMLTALAQRMQHGDIEVIAAHTDDQVTLTITATPYAAGAPGYDDLTGDLLALCRGRLEIEQKGDHLALKLVVPSASRATVLVVDDNPDLIHVYRRYCQGTRFRITTPEEGQSVLAAIRAQRPDVILLDLMLPDIDGWELLALVRQQPEMRTIPLIVCSVVRQEELALALGASGYLTKPVLPDQFILALEKVAPRAGAESQTGREPSSISD